MRRRFLRAWRAFRRQWANPEAVLVEIVYTDDTPAIVADAWATEDVEQWFAAVIEMSRQKRTRDVIH